jgi:hypothetical protein
MRQTAGWTIKASRRDAARAERSSPGRSRERKQR